MSRTTLYRKDFILSDIDALYIFAHTVKLTVVGWSSGLWYEWSILLSASAPAYGHRICFLELCSFLLWYSVAHACILENVCVYYWVVLVIILIFGRLSKVMYCCQVLLLRDRLPVVSCWCLQRMRNKAWHFNLISVRSVPPAHFVKYNVGIDRAYVPSLDKPWYGDIYDMIHLLTAIGLSPGDSTHLHTNNT
jgi:hypothetical protein